MSYGDQKCLLEMWAEDNISQLLENIHRNTEVIKSVEQCHVKVKKLRQKCIKMGDALQKSGSSSDIKDRLIWYEKHDNILNTCVSC